MRTLNPSFSAWNIETNDGQTFAGVITRENPASIFLKFLGGEKEVKTADIKSRTNTGRSLMPEGFDGLGPEVLRDISLAPASLLALSQAMTGLGTPADACPYLDELARRFPASPEAAEAAPLAETAACADLAAADEGSGN